MDPPALMDLIEGSKNIFLARGGVKGPIVEERPTIAFAFASVVATRKIVAGEELSKDNIWLRRPGDGDYGPADYQLLLGRKVQTEIAEGVQIKRTDLVSLDNPKED
jgi:N-acetylneuraminate synthase